MLKLNKKVEYALISLLYIHNQPADSLVSSRELASRFNIPLELLSKILQSLAKDGIITSVQGAKGGYRLAIPSEKISMNDVISSVEEPFGIVTCQSTKEPKKCHVKDNCNIKEAMAKLQRQLYQYFDQVSLRDISETCICDLKPMS